MFMPLNLRILLYTQSVDMRKSIDGLCVFTQEVLQENPGSGAVFVFCNRLRDKLKLLYWDTNGFVLLYKRLEQGRFKFPLQKKKVLLRELELRGLLSGIDFEKIPQAKAINYSVYS